MSLFKEIFYPYLTSIRYNKILFSITRRAIFNCLSCYDLTPFPSLIPPLEVASDSWVCVKGEVSFDFPSHSLLVPKA